ncbi:hypothetical protein SAMN05216404_104173 [Nitrosospira multiformis]|uniref:Uncharacterized protein n=2 Tax=Nitrosospira multiformis TaxID=1231 RepID=A0A1H8GEL3_9PROT|nr:hypothetical protein SAMN05216404_104173 [Nitrosospira multiformis]
MAGSVPCIYLSRRFGIFDAGATIVGKPIANISSDRCVSGNLLSRGPSLGMREDLLVSMMLVGKHGMKVRYIRRQPPLKGWELERDVADLVFRD